MVRQPTFIAGKSIRQAVAVLALSAICGSPAIAQDNAAIIGQVTDASGGVIPGVTVTATSPALQVPSVVAVTDLRGDYRITPLPIGTYQIEYSLTGFQTVRREGIRLTVGFTAKIDVDLKIGALSETVTVSGAAPVVDVTSTTAVTQFTRETLELLPTSRNGMVSLLGQAPGVRTLRDVGGSSLNEVPTSRVFGQSGSAYYTLEGVQTSSLQTSSGQANYWDYTAIEEAKVSTIGNSAEVPHRGVALNAVVKSGSNTFHSSTAYNKTSADWQSNNLDETLRNAQINSAQRVSQRYSFSTDLGGRIVRDKLWFYTAQRRQIDDNFPLNTFTIFGDPTSAPAVQKELAWFHTTKISYQMTQSNKLVGYFQHNHKYDTSGLNQNTRFEERSGLMTPSDTAKLEWQKVYGPKLVMSAQFGFWNYHSHYWSFSPRDVVPSVDSGNSLVRGPATTIGQRPHNPRFQYKGDATLFQPDLFAGNHEFKVGIDYTDNWFGRQYPDFGGFKDVKEPDGAYSSFLYTYRLSFNNNQPDRLVVYNAPSMAHVTTHYLGTFVTDSWSLGRRLTLNLGVRFAHDNGFVPASCREAAPAPANIAFPAECYDKKQFNVWNGFAPRLAGAWDVAGNGKTVIKGGFARFDHERQQVPELDAADPQVQTTTTYRWHDLNANKLYEPGEVDLALNGGVDFISQSGGSNTIPNRNEIQPKSDEWSLTFERELAQNLGVRVSGVYSRNMHEYQTNNIRRPYSAYDIPVTRFDPGPDGVLGGAGAADDPGVSFTWYDYSPTLAGRANELFQLVNTSTVDTYKSIDVAVSKHLSKNWQMQWSYSGTKRHQPTGSLPLSPNTNINGYGDLDVYEWTAKAQGSYLFPFQILAAATWELRSGDPYARTVRFTNSASQSIPNITLQVEPTGTRKLDNSSQLDLRLEKSFNLSKSRKVAIRANAFNALNSNVVLGRTSLSGVNFLRPSSAMPPRIVEFGTTFSF